MPKLPEYLSTADTLKKFHKPDNAHGRSLLKHMAENGLLNPNKNFNKKQFFYLKSEVDEVFLMVHNNEIRLGSKSFEYLNE